MQRAGHLPADAIMLSKDNLADLMIEQSTCVTYYFWQSYTCIQP